MKTSLKDIAQSTNLSVTTVSRVLSGKAEQFRISEETQQLILKAAEKLNYIPNLTAVNLKSGKTQTIALVVPALVNPFFANIAGQIAKEVQETGYITFISDTNENIKLEKENLNHLIARNVDGVILASSGDNGNHINEIQKRGIPIVCIDRYFDDLKNVPYVATDNYRGAYMATKHLIENGHEKIVCIQGVQHSLPNMLRIKGFKKAMEEAGIKDYIITGSEFTLQNGYTETLLLLQDKKRCSAIFSLSNTIALGCIKALHENHVRIPEDISLITFDNNSYLDYLSTPLTCIAQPFENICKIAIRLLFSKINGEKIKTDHVFLKPDLILRNSVKRILI